MATKLLTNELMACLPQAGSSLLEPLVAAPLLPDSVQLLGPLSSLSSSSSFAVPTSPFASSFPFPHFQSVSQLLEAVL